MFGVPFTHRKVVVLIGALAVACTSEAPVDRLTDWHDREAGTLSDAGVEGDAGGSGSTKGACRPPVSSERLPAREAVIGEDEAGGGVAPIFTSDLYRSFEDHCGSCHTKGVNQGSFDVSLETFASKVDEKSLELIRSDDPEVGMPKTPFKKFSERAPDDPVVLFASRLEDWITAGSPRDRFYPSAGDGPDTADSPYRLERRSGMQMSNLGTCIPDPLLMGEDVERAKELDARFEEMAEFSDLPKSLADTDLVSLDSAELAKLGVVAFAPAYTLWADYARKTRYVRVPVGKAIQFKPEDQSFEIPPNTRFYKTFMKQVVDLDGNKRYRKMETRIIVSRPDHIEEDGTAVPRALFGTYKWNEAETEATLHAIAYRDGTGFTDDLATYVADEQLEDQVTRSYPEDLASALLEAGARRHYAIPGADRCVHCHMGAPNESFVLGFTPLQLNRRPLGEGGIIEPAEQDELNQLERLREYGVIAGELADNVTPLEDTQGTRKPRNDYELAAQGYMLGNCAHCHNPRGFPSVREKVLASALNFWPSPEGGIFEFPLDKTSPRTFRGPNLDLPIPYITPSLFDHPSAITAYAAGASPKWVRYLGAGALDPALGTGAANFGGAAGVALFPGRPLLAPWRSLIYRNVDGPFSYADDAAIFPHMPMDTPGYDCRARQVLGSWMLSIPARLKSPLRQYGAAAINPDIADPLRRDSIEFRSDEDQPWVEVPAESRRFSEFVEQAEERVRRFREGERFRDCPESSLDIVAPEVDRSSQAFQPDPQSTVDDPENPTWGYSLSVPARPHYTKTDLRFETVWSPRRSDWKSILVDWSDPESPSRGDGPSSAGDAGQVAPTVSLTQREANVVRVVRTLDYSEEVESFALEQLPFGLWLHKETCADRLAGQRSAESYQGAERPVWMDIVEADPQAKIYQVSRGGQIFTTVCSKCHGPDANGVSSLANTMADLTGGKTRVANLRDGLLGPPGQSGANLLEEFGAADGALGASTEDWTVRYVAWMGLGGTKASIPRPIVNQIAVAPVLGAKRISGAINLSGENAANMLSVVRTLCEGVLSPNAWIDPSAAPSDVKASYGKFQANVGMVERVSEKASLERAGLIQSNGDSLLWESVCTFHNPLPVRVARILDEEPTRDTDPLLLVHLESFAQGGIVPSDGDPALNLIAREEYPAGAAVGDHVGKVVQGLSADNLAPWCVAVHDESLFARYQAQTGRNLPRCPSAFELVGNNGFLKSGFTRGDAEAWAARGAANAGMLVYAYLRALADGRVSPQVAYDRCEELAAP